MDELEASEPMPEWEPVCEVRTREGEVLCQWWWIFNGQRFLMAWKRVPNHDDYDRAMAAREPLEEYVSRHIPRPF